MKAVVTGGAGFIGSRLAAALLRAGYETLVIDDLSFGDAGALPEEVRLERMDVCDPGLSGLMARERPDVVYHLAAQAGISRTIYDPLADLTTNVIGTLNVLEGCRLAGAKMVLASSDAVFGDRSLYAFAEETPVRPLSPYGRSKWMAERFTERFCRLHQVPYTILRLSSVYGPGQRGEGEGRVVAVFLDRLRAGKPLTVCGDGRQVRDFVHVDDAVRAFVLAAGSGTAENETIHIGTGQPLSIMGVIGELAALGGERPEFVYADGYPVDAPRSVFIPDKAARLLGWTPQVGFAAGLKAAREAALGPAVAGEDEDERCADAAAGFDLMDGDD